MDTKLGAGDQEVSQSVGKNTASVPLQLFPVVRIFPKSLGVIYFDRWVFRDGIKNYVKNMSFINWQPALLIFYVSYDSMKWPCNLKFVNQINLTYLYQFLRFLFWFCWLRILSWIKFTWYLCLMWNKIGKINRL